jgi:DNA-3-methyladenine glycosylase
MYVSDDVGADSIHHPPKHARPNQTTSTAVRAAARRIPPGSARLRRRFPSIAKPSPLTAEFFARDALLVARDLVGAVMLHGGVGGVIVETEAYKGDAASHFVTRRHKAAMMGTTHGRIYVYSIYGMHHCVNVTADRSGPGAVLLRAIEPTHGVREMLRRRGVADVRQAASGPAKLFVALGLDPSMTGRDACETFSFLPRARYVEVAAGPRIGVSRATRLPWRFWARGNEFVSR